MQSNLSINSAQPSFGAKVAKKFIDSAHKAFEREIKNPAMKFRFDEKATKFEGFGYDDYYVKYVKKEFNGKKYHQLLAVRSGMDDSAGVVLTTKDRFRKVIEKFIHMNKYEFTAKMEQHRQKLFTKYRPE